MDEFYKHIKKYSKDSSYEFIEQCIIACPDFDQLTCTRASPLCHAIYYECDLSIIRLIERVTRPNYNFKCLHNYFIITPFDMFTHNAESHCEKHYRNSDECYYCDSQYTYETYCDVDFLIYMSIYNILTILYHRALGTIGYIDNHCIYEYKSQGYIEQYDIPIFPIYSYKDIDLYNYVRSCCSILDLDLTFIATRTIDLPSDMNDYDAYEDTPRELKIR